MGLNWEETPKTAEQKETGETKGLWNVVVGELLGYLRKKVEETNKPKEVTTNAVPSAPVDVNATVNVANVAPTVTSNAPETTPDSTPMPEVTTKNNWYKRMKKALGLSSKEFAKTLYSGRLQGKKFFGLYATGDPDAEKYVKIYEGVKERGIEWSLHRYEGTPITVEMIEKAAKKYGVDAKMIMAAIAQDSGAGTKGKGVRTKNPGNVGNTDDGSEVSFKTRQDGINAVGKNIAKRQRALMQYAWIQTLEHSTNTPTV